MLAKNYHTLSHTHIISQWSTKSLQKHAQCLTTGPHTPQQHQDEQFPSPTATTSTLLLLLLVLLL